MPSKTKSHLIAENAALRARLAGLENELADRISRNGGELPESETAERKRIQEALKVSEIRYRRLFETAKDGILILDAETGQITDANPFVKDLLGYSHAELLGRRLWEIGPFRDIAASRGAFSKLQKKKYIRYDNLPLETKGRRHKHVEFVSNVYQENGAKVIQCNIRDITARHQAEERISKSRERLRNLSGRQQSLLEEERERISREIHDELGQALTAMKLDLSSVRRSLIYGGLSEQAAKVHEIELAATRIIRTVRRIATDLRPGILDELGVGAAIKWMAKNFQNRTGISCSCLS
ncbi:MAG: PAS domain-containing protein [Desulfobacteria bacterium]